MRTKGGVRGNIFVRGATKHVDPQRFSEIAMLALAFHSQLMMLQTQPVQPRGVLTAREREVLAWFAAGKSADDVSVLMGISVPTVMFHYKKVACRFGTLTRAHTVVEAIRRGSIAV
ncbi:MAG: helix-turn-helix transcriptional regulator [Devosia sp.]